MAAQTTPPGTEALGRMFAAAEAPVLLLFDEVLNFVNRHRGMADGFYAFLQNLTVALTGSTRAVAVLSLPRSPVEMTDWDLQWQERITKMIGRVAQDLIANDESEISEVVRIRLFEDLGRDRVRKNVSKAYADWCFERSNRLPPEWTAVDSATTGSRAREYLQRGLRRVTPSIRHPIRLPTKVARPAPVPADSGRAGDAGAVDIVGSPRPLPACAHGAADYPGLRAPGRAGIPRGGPRSAGRVTA